MEFPSFDIPPNSTAGIRVTSKTKENEKNNKRKKNQLDMSSMLTVMTNSNTPREVGISQ